MTSGASPHRDLSAANRFPTALSRRRALQMLGVGLVGVAACSSGSSSSPSTTAASGEPESSSTSTKSTTSSTSTTTSGANGGSTSAIPEETAGPYPGDGSNGPNVLADDGIVRADIRSSYGASSGTAAGVPLTVTLTLLDLAAGATPRTGAAIYAWHCDRDGRYSLYTAPDQNYLRGVQVTGADGTVTFETIFPGCYPGRWPHIHFEVYESLAAAHQAGTRLTTSQLALPEPACRAAYRTAGYEASASNLGQVSLATDNVFSDGWSLELATVTGRVADGYTATLRVPV